MTSLLYPQEQQQQKNKGLQLSMYDHEGSPLLRSSIIGEIEHDKIMIGTPSSMGTSISSAAERSKLVLDVESDHQYPNEMNFPQQHPKNMNDNIDNTEGRLMPNISIEWPTSSFLPDFRGCEDDDRSSVASLIGRTTFMSLKMRSISRINEDNEETETLNKSLKSTRTQSLTPSLLGYSCRSAGRLSMNRSLYFDPCGLLDFCWSKLDAHSLLTNIDENALLFSVRMAILLTLSGLFVMAHPDARMFFVTTLMVSWFPALDAAQVIEKVIQRTVGTCIGGSIGLGCGFLSLIIYNRHGQKTQNIFLGVFVFFGTLAIVFFTGQYKVDGKKVQSRFPHATLMCLITYNICLLPFGGNSNPKWKAGVNRVVWVFFGCIMGAVGSIVIFPKSTNDLLFEKTAKQVKLAGTAAESVLQTAADYFASGVEPTQLTESILRQPLEISLRWKFNRSSALDEDFHTDVDVNLAMRKYEDAIMDWFATKALLPLVKYDPFAVRISVSNMTDNTDYKTPEVNMLFAKTLARALRIQTTIVMLDGMFRKDAEYNFTTEQLLLFSTVGRLLREMLTVPLKVELSDDAARQLFDKLEDIRQIIMIESSRVTEAMKTLQNKRSRSIQKFKSRLLGEMNDDHPLAKESDKKGELDSEFEPEDEEGRGIPRSATSRFENTLFFVILIEHLILRSLRLYEAWKQVEIESD